MNRLLRMSVALFFALALASGLAQAQSASGKDSGDNISEHFKSGTQQIGEGAKHIGEGIKQGAIDTWEAVKAGVSAATAKFSGGKGEGKSNHAPAGSGGTAR